MKLRYSHHSDAKALDKMLHEAHKLYSAYPPWHEKDYGIANATKIHVWSSKDRCGWRAGKYKSILFKKTKLS